MDFMRGESMLELFLSSDDSIFFFSLQDSAATDLRMSKIAIFLHRAWMLRIFSFILEPEGKGADTDPRQRLKCHLGTAGSKSELIKWFFSNAGSEIKLHGWRSSTPIFAKWNFSHFVALITNKI